MSDLLDSLSEEKLAYDIQIKLSIHLNFSFTTQNENENTTQETWKSNLSYCDDLTFYS